MIRERMALLRQAQEYFHRHLLGTVKWDDVQVDKPIPIPPVKGHRDQGKFRDVVIAHFDGFLMEMFGPFESDDWPLGFVKVTRGASSAYGPLDAATWVMIADFIKQQKQQGANDGTEDAASVRAGDTWGR